MPPRGNPGENHTKNISSLTGKAIRHSEDEGGTSVKKRRYGNVLVAPTPDITASSTDESDVTEVFPSKPKWRSFASEHNCHVRFGNVALNAKSKAKDDSIKVHLRDNYEDSEWVIRIEDTKEFPGVLDISALAIDRFAYVEKSLFIITPNTEFFQRTLDSAPAIADLIGNSGDASVRCILITFDKDSSADFFKKFGRKVNEERIHAVKLSEEDGKRCLKEAIGADAKLAKAVASLSRSKAAESTVDMSESQQLAPSCPNPFNILVDLLGVAAFLGKDAMFCFVPSKRVLKICPSRYARPMSCMTVQVEKFEYYQYDHSTGAFHLAIKDNSAADIAQELIKLSDAKDLMEPGASKLRGSAMRAILNENVNPDWLKEILTEMKIPFDKLPNDNLAKSLFPHIKGIGLPRAHHVNGTSVKGPLDNIVPLDNSLQPEKSHLNPISVPTRPNKPKTSWPAMVSAPKDVRQSNGLLPPSNIDLRMFETSQHPSLRKDTSNAARNPKLSRSVHVPTAPRQRTLRNDSTKENKKMRTIENELPGSLYSYESRPVAVIPLSSQRARLNARSNPQISVTVAQSDKSVTKLIIDTKYLQNPFKKSIIDALIERMEQATVSGNPRRSITSGSQSNAIVPNPTVSNGDPVCIDLSEDDEPNSSGSGDLMGSSAFVAECPDGAHEIFRDVHLFDSVKLGNGEITAGEIFQLAKGQQLGDGVVQFLLEFFDMSTPRSDRIHVFSYFFFQSYLGAVGRENQSFTVMTEAVYRRLLDHTRKVDLFSCRYLVIPVLKDQHWYLAIVCSPNPLMEAETKNGSKQKQCLVIMDSLVSSGAGTRHKETFTLIQLWLEKEYEQKFKKAHSFAPKLYPRMIVSIPQQQNGVDCGVFMLQACNIFLKDQPVFHPTKVKDNIFSGRSPKVPEWFGADVVCVQKMRLQFLHFYYHIACWKKHFVYRDDYIPTLIDEVGQENELMDQATRTASYDDIEPSKPETERKMGESLSAPKPGAVPQPAAVPVAESFAKIYQTVQTLHKHGVLTPADQDLYMRAGYLPTPAQQQKTTYTPAEKLKIVLERRKQRRLQVEKEAREAVQKEQEKTAEEMYQEFLDS